MFLAWVVAIPVQLINIISDELDVTNGKVV